MSTWLYADGRHYDRLYPSPPTPEALAFWLALARQTGGTVLELACGTGRLALPLAEAGLAVTGLDEAAPMLDEARRRAAAAGLAVEWVQGDMTAFDLGRRFGLIILAANSFAHLLDRAAVEGCLAGVRRHLSADGRFVVDLFVPDLQQLTRPPDERHPFGEYDDPDTGARITIAESNRYEPDTQINRIRTFTLRPGALVETVGHLDLRMYYPQELDALLAYNGLPVERKLAGYDGTPFGPHATKQLVICAPAR